MKRLVYINGVEAQNGDVLRIVRHLRQYSTVGRFFCDFFFRSGIFTHWGIYCVEQDDAYVIHYSTPDEDKHEDFKGIVLKTPVEKFMQDASTCTNMTKVIEQKFPYSFSGNETARRAEESIGTGRYNLLSRNCEHFAMWCKTGKMKSSQTEILEILG